MSQQVPPLSAPHAVYAEAVRGSDCQHRLLMPQRTSILAVSVTISSSRVYFSTIPAFGKSGLGGHLVFKASLGYLVSSRSIRTARDLVLKIGSKLYKVG